MTTTISDFARVTERDTRIDWRHGNGLPGGGPWMILAECTSRIHNTYNSARRGKRRPHPCICPRALAELAAKRAQDHARRDPVKEAARVRDRRKAERQRKRLPSYTSTTGAPKIFLPGARCNTAGGRSILDKISEHEEGATEAARWMCSTCPAREMCPVRRDVAPTRRQKDGE